MPETFIPRNKSVIVAADIPIDKLNPLVRATHDVEGIEGYKVCIALGLRGLQRTVRMIRNHTNLPIIYDHQKAGNDIPGMGDEFVNVCAEAGVNAVILFPFAGPATQERWTKASQDAGLTVLTGGHMTHEQFLVSEGGYISDDAPPRIYTLAARLGVRDFVVPGNKVDYVTKYRELLQQEVGSDDFTLWAPGFITQKGEISQYAEVAGNKWHAIVGSGIYAQEDMHRAAELVTSQIR